MSEEIKLKNDREEQDSPWKELIEKFLPEFMKFFFPKAYNTVDWTRPHEFLEQELYQIHPEGETGKRIADKLVKVWTKKGKEKWWLIHIEIQGNREKKFEVRMYSYNYRAFDKYHRPVQSFVILTDNNKRWRPSSFSYGNKESGLELRFATVKLIDYKEEELEKMQSPFAMVVLAQLRANRTKNNKGQRYQEKLRLIRRLFERNYDREYIIGLFKFIDWLMVLPKQLNKQLREETRKIVGEPMPYITSFEKIAKEEGRKEEGLNVVMRLLNKKFGVITKLMQSKIEALSIRKLEALAESLLDFNDVSDLERWLSQN